MQPLLGRDLSLTPTVPGLLGMVLGMALLQGLGMVLGMALPVFLSGLQLQVLGKELGME